MGARRVPFVRSAVAVLAAAAIVAGCAAEPGSAVVTSSCDPGPSTYTETVTSTVHHSGPRSGQTVTFEVQVRRLQVDVGPVVMANYLFPIPDAAFSVESVTFAEDDGNPHLWSVIGGDVLIGFRAPEGSWLTNDFPMVSITYRLDDGLAPGTPLEFAPYRNFTQQFRDFFIGCTRTSPAVLQELAIVA